MPTSMQTAGGLDMPAQPGAGDEKFARALRHSRTVRLLKFVLPVSAAAMAVCFVAYSYMATPAPVAVDVEGTAFSEGKLVMANPKLEGFTKDNRPYSMSAVRAIQNVDQQGVIALEEIAAKLPLDASTVATVDAERGLYDREKNTLDIPSAMTLTTSEGLSAKLQAVFLDISNGAMRTAAPVEISNNGSTIRSDSLSVTDHGEVLVFENRVRVELDPARVRQQQGSGETDASQ